MLRFSAILAAIVFMVAGMNNTLLWLQFEAKQGYYAKQLCEQKEIEGNDCQGHCQLKAILKGESSNAPSKPLAPEYQEEVLGFMGEDDNGSLNQFLRLKHNQLCSHLATISVFKGYSLGIWRPPRA